MKFITSVFLTCVTFIILFLVIFTPTPCEHEDMVWMYSFSTHYYTNHSYVRPYCRDCETKYQYRLFQGTPIDQSYLSAIIEHSDGDEIVPGEYYTVTTTVPGAITAGHISNRVVLECKAENEDYIVYFHVEFREEFADMVRSVQAGDEITFRARFYEEGCEFTEGELLSKLSK